MTDRHEGDARSEGALATLWRRAPWWRATAVTAVVVTGAAALLWAESQPGHAPAQPTAASTPAVQAAARDAQVAQPSPPTPSPSLSSPTGGMANPTTSSPMPQTASEQEDQLQAMCHPHLLHGPPSMPQVDVTQVATPNLGHIKLHMWINGAGFVTRELVTAASLGTPAEQRAEAAYAKQLTFALPNTKECRSREVEVIGDFFERRETSGQWATYVRLYPRFTFGSTGALQSAD